MGGSALRLLAHRIALGLTLLLLALAGFVPLRGPGDGGAASPTSPGRTVILLGDSILDNGHYVGPNGRDVTAHLRALAPNWNVEKRADDGSRSRDVSRQAAAAPVPGDAVLVVSVGGNDALAHRSRLHEREPMTFGRAMAEAHPIREGFRHDYAKALDALARLGRPTLVLTLYAPPFQRRGAPPDEQRAVEAALSLFNDVIQQEALARGFAVLDLRRLCTEDGDFSPISVIEPSDAGGHKIAGGIAAWLGALGDGPRGAR